MTSPHCRIGADQRGAIMLIGVFMAIFLCACLFYVVSIGHTVLYRTHLQDAVDNAAMAGAIVNAKGMNALVFINIMMAALLAVLVALRLISTLATAVGVVAGAACIYPPLAFLCAVPALMADVVDVTETAYDKAKNPIELALQGLHGLAVAVRTVTPVLGTAKALAVVYSHHQDVATIGLSVPSTATLPTTDDTFQHLCEKAGDLTGGIVGLPLDPIVGKNNAVSDFLGDAIGSLTGSVPDWFCGSGDAKPPKTTRKHTLYHPTLDSAEICNAAVKANAEDAYDLCKISEQDIKDSQPDPKTGDCAVRCEDDEPYWERAQKARVQCNPHNNSKLHDFQWQYRHLTRYLIRDGDAWRVEKDDVHEARLELTKKEPCTDNHGWNTQLQSSTWRDAIAPVCILTSDEMDDKSGLRKQLETEEVTQVFSCGHTEEITMEPNAKGGMHPDSSESNENKSGKDKQDNKQKGSKNMSPQKMEDDVYNGGGDLQVRGFALGKELNYYGESLMKVASRGEHEDTFATLQQAGRLQLAQSEYFFADGSDDRDLMMWRMQWTARLRRFRIGGYDDDNKDESSSKETSKSAPVSVEGAMPSSKSKKGFDWSLVKKMCKDSSACDIVNSYDVMDVLVAH